MPSPVSAKRRASSAGEAGTPVSVADGTGAAAMPMSASRANGRG
jgi:hypothetical protein